MRQVVLALAALLLSATSVSAQGAPDPNLRAAGSLGEDVLLTVGGLSASILAVDLTGEVLRAAGLSTELGLPLGYAAGATGLALGVHGTARLLGVEGSLRNAMGDAWTGAAVGLAAGGATFLLLDASLSDGSSCSGETLVCFNSGRLDAVLLGAAVAVVVPVAWVVSDYRDVAPTVLRSPDGTSAPGLSLRVGL